jgi:hypothetical protein
MRRLQSRPCEILPAAEAAFAGPVPTELMDYLKANKGRLVPELDNLWKANGYKEAGTWQEVCVRCVNRTFFESRLNSWVQDNKVESAEQTAGTGLRLRTGPAWPYDDAP